MDLMPIDPKRTKLLELIQEGNAINADECELNDLLELNYISFKQNNGKYVVTTKGRCALAQAEQRREDLSKKAMSTLATLTLGVVTIFVTMAFGILDHLDIFNASASTVFTAFVEVATLLLALAAWQFVYVSLDLIPFFRKHFLLKSLASLACLIATLFYFSRLL